MELKDILSTDDKLRIIQELVPGKQITLASNVDLSFVDRFSGTLIITGMVADVETSLRAIMDYAERTLKFTVCEITKT